MTRLFALEELTTRCFLPKDVRDKHHIPTGPSRLVESSEERRIRQGAEAWEDLLEALRQSSANRLELLLHRRGEDLVSCPWGRLAPCDVACRCAGSGVVTIDFLRDHYEHLVTAVVRCVQSLVPYSEAANVGKVSLGVAVLPLDRLQVEAKSELVPCSGKDANAEVSSGLAVLPKVGGRRRMPRRQAHWTGESRLRYANARYAQLLARLCDREAATVLPGDRVLVPGHGPCAVCRRLFPLGQLEIGHVDAALWDTRVCSMWVRAARFWKEHESGVRLRVLCQDCGVESLAREGS